MQLFPDLVFGWVFTLGVLAFVSYAAWREARRLPLPPRYVAWGLSAGAAINAVRGAWLGAQGVNAWPLGPGDGWWGLLGGLLFAAMGYGFGYLFFWPLRKRRLCADADARLFTVISTWVGIGLAAYILGLALLLVLVFGVLKAGYQFVVRRSVERSSREAGFALPLALATALMVFVGYRFELGLAEATTKPAESLTDPTAPNR